MKVLAVALLVLMTAATAAAVFQVLTAATSGKKHAVEEMRPTAGSTTTGRVRLDLKDGQGLLGGVDQNYVWAYNCHSACFYCAPKDDDDVTPPLTANAPLEVTVNLRGAARRLLEQEPVTGTPHGAFVRLRAFEYSCVIDHVTRFMPNSQNPAKPTKVITADPYNWLFYTGSEESVRLAVGSLAEHACNRATHKPVPVNFKSKMFHYDESQCKKAIMKVVE
eukprot:gnl/Hemi2/16962_TR5636_c0_g1_i1.p1 gnl/Hemi2/16962_TR5636_c0_g1~~gnl/Hemi2/16962_TR5636_c0_g1_i1.p1  ORF type:complete len:221 (-),score=30.26 gnl/Hemi2/16962_TR5636_c0_g1_i1:40-702(-)